MRHTALTLLLTLFFRVGHGQMADSSLSTDISATQLFELGNESFKNDAYKEAIGYYLMISEWNLESSELYFNIGNAYFKLNDVPHAILYYEKARKLAPQDEDIKTNLELAKLKTIDKVETKPELPFTTWWNQLLNSNEIDDWGKKSIYLSFFALLLLILYLFLNGLAKKISFFSGLFVVFLSLSFYFLGQMQKKQQTSGKHAIIFSPSVTVKGSPEDDGTRLFVIHEGTKVEILKSIDDWTEISLMNGNKGWVKSGVYKGI